MVSGTAAEYPSPFKNILVSGPLFTVGQQQKSIQKGSQVPEDKAAQWSSLTPAYSTFCLSGGFGFFCKHQPDPGALDLESGVESIL